MKRRYAVPLVTVLLALLLPLDAALAQQLPPGPTTRYQSTQELTNQPATFDLIQLVLDFAPGAWTPPHSHGGPGLVTVLEGEMIVRERGVERRYRAGERWLEGIGEVAEVGNPGSTRASILVTFVLPKGAALTTVEETQTQQLPPGPTTTFQSRTELTGQPSTFDLIQLVLDFAPGAWTPPHSHGGPGLVTVLEGQMTVRERGTERRFGVGETWIEVPRDVAEVGNPAATRASIAVSFVLPKGASLTTIQPAALAGLPRTGVAGTAGSPAPILWLLPVFGIIAGASGWLLRRRQRASPRSH